MEREPEHLYIRVEELPTMEWMLEQLVAENELVYIPREEDKLDESKKRYDVAQDVDGCRRAELISLLRRYQGTQ